MGYDANGNLSWRGVQGYVFDIANRLRAVPGVATYVEKSKSVPNVTAKVSIGNW
jgi:hypothetical protein